MKRTTIRELFKSNPLGQDIFVQGWVKTVRGSKKFSFMNISDGTCQKTLQVILDATLLNYKEISALLPGSSVGLLGKLVESKGQGQMIELQVHKAQIYGATDKTYPLQKKATSLEFLRENAHLRGRTNLFGAIFRIRHELAMATHRFFSERGFYYLNTPILTAVDAEGAGEMFSVQAESPDFFDRRVGLCVSGQLEAECLAMGLNAVYTFGPTFRAENSNTPRHLAEFWMIEPEMAFTNLEENASLAEDYLKYLIGEILTRAPEEMESLAHYHNDKKHLEDLEKMGKASFKRISYGEAIKILEKKSQIFQFPPEWGKELQTEHERYLVEEYFSIPVIITDYPKNCKAFYMKQNEDQKTVKAMDVLVPGVGEIIGGSERENDLAKLEKRMEEMDMEKDPLWWYLELRKFVTAPHSGFGLGFERAIRYITNMKNIRDVIPFPRTPKHCEF